MIEDSKKSRGFAIAAIVIFSLLSVCFLCCVICGFKSLKLAIDVIDASADFLTETKRILLVPIFYFLVSVIVFMGWVYAFMNVASMNEIKASQAIIP